MAEHKHGEMDVTTQVDTYDGFLKYVTWMIAAIVFILLFMMIFSI